MVISASDLQIKGISIIEASLNHNPEAIISVQGKNKYVVMNLEHYNHMREFELISALNETMQDLENGDFNIDTIANHMKRVLSNEL